MNNHDLMSCTNEIRSLEDDALLNEYAILSMECLSQQQSDEYFTEELDVKIRIIESEIGRREVRSNRNVSVTK